MTTDTHEPLNDGQQDEKQKGAGRKGITRRMKRDLVIAAVLTLLYIILRPVYQDYKENDLALSCYTAREYTGICYNRLIQSRTDTGIDAESLDYRWLVREAFLENYDVTVTDDLTIPDLCRMGGVMEVTIDDVTHRLTITCSVPGHRPYVQ